MSINSTMVLGIALIVLGIVAFSSVTGEDVADPAPAQARAADADKAVSLAPIFGAMVLAGGIVLVAAETRKSWMKQP